MKPATMPVLTATGLRKAFGTDPLLADADFAIHSGERVGLVGNNGSGKSTLAKILAGLLPADGGNIAVRRQATVRYLAQVPDLDPKMTAREVVREGLESWTAARARHERASADLAAGVGDADQLVAQQADAAAEVERLGGWQREHDVDAMLNHLGVTRPQGEVGTLSGGERRRVALGKLLLSRPDLAILDEPTNHLDVDTVEWLEKYLAEEHGGALLLVTHDRYVLDRVVTRTLELDGGQLYSYDGGWSSYLAAKAERQEFEARAEANRQNFLRTELEWLRRSPKARSTKQKARVHRAEAAVSATGPRREQTARLGLDTTRQGGTILDLRGVSLELGGKRLIEGLDLSLTRGERVGVVGKNGTGKTSLLRLLLGELEASAGQVTIGKNTRFAYFDQGRTGLDDELSIQECVAGKKTRLTVGEHTMDVRTYLSRFLFDPQGVRQKVGSLSGGERARVALARLLLSPANLLLLDEPTNDLDVATLGALEMMLLESDASAIVVSHDRYFLDRVATCILSFEGEGEVLRYPGDYTSYRELRDQAMRDQRAKEKVAAPSPKAKKPKSQKKGLSYKEERELEGLPEAIEIAEAAVAALDAELADPAIYADRGAEVPALIAKQAEARDAIDELMARWELLETKKADG